MRTKSKGKAKKSVLFAICLIAIVLLAFAGFKGFMLMGWEFKSFDKVITKGLDLQGGVSVLMEIQEDDVKSEDLKKTRQLLDLRVNKLGVAETVVATEGSKRIRVDIPGQVDSKEIVDSLSKTGNLEFKDSKGNVVLTGKDVKEASVMLDNQTGKPVVSLKLNDEGTKKFAEATKNNIGKNIAITMDDEVVSNPVVQSAITDGNATITGNSTVEEANNLAGIINSGALPVKVKAVSVKNIGAQLGAQALPNAMKAGIVGVALIFIFMSLYYRIPGILSCFALTLYATLVLFIFVEVGATLTLPGIAGFLLTIGMAVDANVLIFERIREELRRGLSVKAAVKRGFENALTSIVDSNVTTIICALVLYFLGTGAVKGFAVTLMIGIVVSMFTALVVTKILMNLAVDIGLLKSLGQFRVKRGAKNA